MPATDSRAARLKARESKRLLLSKKISKDSKKESKRRAAGGPDSCSAPGCTMPPLEHSRIIPRNFYSPHIYKFDGWCGSYVCVRVVSIATGIEHHGFEGVVYAGREYDKIEEYVPSMKFVMGLRKRLSAVERANSELSAYLDVRPRAAYEDPHDHSYHTGYTTPSYTPSDGHADDTIPGTYSPTCPSYSPVDYDSTDSA